MARRCHHDTIHRYVRLPACSQPVIVPQFTRFGKGFAQDGKSQVSTGWAGTAHVAGWQILPRES